MLGLYSLPADLTRVPAGSRDVVLEVSARGDLRGQAASFVAAPLKLHRVEGGLAFLAIEDLT